MTVLSFIAKDSQRFSSEMYRTLIFTFRINAVVLLTLSTRKLTSKTKLHSFEVKIGFLLLLAARDLLYSLEMLAFCFGQKTTVFEIQVPRLWS